MPIYINKVIHKYFVDLNQTYDTSLERKSNIKLRCFSRYQYFGTTSRSIDRRFGITSASQSEARLG